MRGNEKGTRDALQEETPQAAPAVGTQAATSTPIPVTIAKRLAGKKDAVLVRGSNVSGAEYVLYEPGTRTHYTKDWKALQQEASGDDAVRTAMRYRQPEDVVSLNPSAQAKLDNEAAAIEAQKQADAVAAADRLKSVELRESLRASLEGVKFKGGQFVGAEQTEPVKANFAGPLAVHKSYGHFRKGQQEFTVSHVGTQLAVLKGFKSLAAAKQAAVRLDRAGPFAELKGPESLREPEFERIKKVALAIKSSGMDPLASPEIDAPQRGVPNAIQEPSPAQVDVRDRAEDGGAVEQRDAQAQEASKEGEAPPKEYVGVALPPSEQAKAILRDPKTSEQLDSVTVTHRVWDAKAGKWVPQEMSALKAAKSIISDIDKLTAYRQCLEGG